MCFIHVLHVLNMPMDASLACWALFPFSFSHFSISFFLFSSLFLIAPSHFFFSPQILFFPSHLFSFILLSRSSFSFLLLLLISPSNISLSFLVDQLANPDTFFCRSVNKICVHSNYSYITFKQLEYPTTSQIKDNFRGLYFYEF